MPHKSTVEHHSLRQLEDNNRVYTFLSSSVSWCHGCPYRGVPLYMRYSQFSYQDSQTLFSVPYQAVSTTLFFSRLNMPLSWEDPPGPDGVCGGSPTDSLLAPPPPPPPAGVVIDEVGVGVVSRTVEIGGAGCEVEIEAVVVVSGEGLGTSSLGRDWGGSPFKNDFLIVWVCVHVGEGRVRKREGERGWGERIHWNCIVMTSSTHTESLLCYWYP